VWWRNTLRILGKCVTSPGSAVHTKIVLSRCTGGTQQEWIKRTDGTLYNASNLRCLNVPGAVTTPGTQVEINTCTTSRGERWTLPG